MNSRPVKATDVWPGQRVCNFRTDMEPRLILTVEKLENRKVRILWEGMTYAADVDGETILWVLFDKCTCDPCASCRQRFSRCCVECGFCIDLRLR